MAGIPGFCPPSPLSPPSPPSPAGIFPNSPELIPSLSRLESWSRLRPVFGSMLLIRPPMMLRSVLSWNGDSPVHPVGIPWLLNCPMDCWSSEGSTEKPVGVPVMLPRSDCSAGEISCLPSGVLRNCCMAGVCMYCCSCASVWAAAMFWPLWACVSYWFRSCWNCWSRGSCVELL